AVEGGVDAVGEVRGEGAPPVRDLDRRRRRRPIAERVVLVVLLALEEVDEAVAPVHSGIKVSREARVQALEASPDRRGPLDPTVGLRPRVVLEAVAALA